MRALQKTIAALSCGWSLECWRSKMKQSDKIIEHLKAENKAFKKRLARLAGKVPNKPKRLSRRDQFAMSAMQAVLGNLDSYKVTTDMAVVRHIMIKSVLCADALIKQLDRDNDK